MLSINDYRDLAEVAKVSLREASTRPLQERDEPTQLDEAMRHIFKGNKPEDFSIQKIWDHAVPDGRSMRQLLEAKNTSILHESAVNTALFSNITNRLLSQKMLEPLAPANMPFSSIIPVQPTKLLRGERIAGVADLGDVGQAIGEQQVYPTAGTSEDYIDTPVTTKRGIVVQVTKEAIIADMTGQLLMRARKVGESLAIAKEKRAIDCIIDENRTVHRYKWKGTSYATYQTSTPYDNVTASNALEDWTDIDAANQTFNAMVDPNTGEPIMVVPTHLICAQQLEWTAKRILDPASALSIAIGGFPTSGSNPSQTAFSNPVKSVQLLTSPLVASRLATDTTWFYGAPGQAFLYMEVWPITVVEAPTSAHEEFHQDIVSQFKASEMGEFTTIEPRAMNKCTVA